MDTNIECIMYNMNESHIILTAHFGVRSDYLQVNYSVVNRPTQSIAQGTGCLEFRISQPHSWEVVLDGINL